MPEVRECAVRMVLEHGGDHPTQWSAITSVAAKIGCTGETVRNGSRKILVDQAAKRPFAFGFNRLSNTAARTMATH